MLQGFAAHCKPQLTTSASPSLWYRFNTIPQLLLQVGLRLAGCRTKVAVLHKAAANRVWYFYNLTGNNLFTIWLILLPCNVDLNIIVKAAVSNFYWLNPLVTLVSNPCLFSPNSCSKRNVFFFFIWFNFLYIFRSCLLLCVAIVAVCSLQISRNLTQMTTTLTAASTVEELKFFFSPLLADNGSLRHCL